MTFVRRRIVALLTIACLGAAMPAAVAHAQGAGDQQYQDPFDNGSGSSSGSGSSGSSGSNSGSGSSPTLSSKPQGSSSAGSSAGSSGSSGAGAVAGASASSSTSSAAGTSSEALPNTGADARLIVAVGLVLVLTGLGLRLRSAPERF